MLAAIRQNADLLVVAVDVTEADALSGDRVEDGRREALEVRNVELLKGRRHDVDEVVATHAAADVGDRSVDRRPL